MNYNSEKYHRRSIRIPGYDYSQEGYYFITICVKDHKCIFGEVAGDKMNLNNLGKIVESEWLKTSELRTNVELDEYIIMPNHIHGIIHLLDNVDKCRGTMHRAATTEHFGKPVVNSIPTIVRSFKSVITRKFNESCKEHGLKLWQRNYGESHAFRRWETFTL